MRREKIYLAVTGVITAVFIGIGLWLFRDSYLRLWESVCDLGDSLKYYVGRLFGKTWGHSSVNELSKVFSPAGMLPENAGELAEKIKRYFALLSDGENFRAWSKAVLTRAGTAGRAVMVALPCLLIVIVLIRRLYRKGNTRHNRDTIFLKAFKRAVCWVVPVKKAVSGYFGFLRESRAVKAGWVILWAVQLNLVSIGVSATAYYLWFSVSYDFSTLYMEYHTVYNLSSVKTWVALKRKRFQKHRDENRQLYGYDYKRYGLVFKDGLKTSGLFGVLETYGQAYFIYVMQSSLILSNYSVRTDNALMDRGNFPLWFTDFFSGERDSRHAHVLDFDVLRLGKKMKENNPKAGSFEFGVVAITEIGKERGNNLELKEVKKGTEEANQKNDLFNSWLKMCRHSATVEGVPFIKVFADEQRPESWGAVARDLADVITILSSGDKRLALPFYTTEKMLSEWAYNCFLRLYTEFRFRRGDNTLLVHLLKSGAAWLWRRNLRIQNRYGYSVLKIEKERGTLDGKPEKKKYFLMNAKIYAKRFSTDCFSDYFNDLAKRSGVGLSDYPEYRTEKATVAELKEQNSYFINGLYGG